MWEKLIEIIRNQTEDEDIAIDRDSDLFTDLGMDELDIVEFVAALEEEFKVEISDWTIDDFKTVGDVMDFLQTY